MTAADVEKPTFTGEVHPAAAVWPMLSDEDLAELAASIAEIGLTDPLTLDRDGRLIDGRNRLDACYEAGVSPRFVVYDGDPIPFIIAKNAERRHMSTGARAMAVARMLADAGKRKNGRWERGSVPDTSGSGSSAFAKRIAEAGAIIDHLPVSTIEKVIAGDKALDAAYAEAKKVRDEAESETARIAKLADCDCLPGDRCKGSWYAAQVKSGDMGLDAAEAAHAEDRREWGKGIERSAKALEAAAKAWETLRAFADGTFAPDMVDDALERVPAVYQDHLRVAANVIKKGLA